MRIAYTPEQQELRDRLREYFAELMTPERREQLHAEGGEYGDGTAYREIVRDLGAHGWLTMSWPTKYGGAERTMLEQPIFTDKAATAEDPVPFRTLNRSGPTLSAFGPR